MTKFKFSKIFLDDCTREYGSQIISIALADFEKTKKKILKPMKWIEKTCEYETERHNVETFETNWQKEKMEFKTEMKNQASPLAKIIKETFKKKSEKKSLDEISVETFQSLHQSMGALELVRHLIVLKYDHQEIKNKLVAMQHTWQHT